MEAFLFTEAEWATVREAMLPVVNATLADDQVLHASHLVGLLETLAALRARYGDHPVLLETEADFTDDKHEQVALYRRATVIASAHHLSTFSIRLSLAGVLLDLGRPAEAAVELLACRPELSEAEEFNQQTWSDLSSQAAHSPTETGID